MEAQLDASVRVQVGEIQVNGSDVTHAVFLAMWLKHVQWQMVLVEEN